MRESKYTESRFKDALMGDYEMFVRIGMNVCQNMYECIQDKYGYKPLMKNEKLNVSESQAFTPTYLHTFFTSNNAI